MLFTIILLLSLGTIPADIIHFYRLWGKIPSRRWWIYVVLATLTEALPFSVAVTGICYPDNTQLLMDFAAWALYLWVLTVPTRILYFFFLLIGFRRTGITLAWLSALCIVWGGTLGRTTIRISDVEVRSKQLPASFDGFRIAQLTDIHVGSLVNPERELTQIVEQVNALKPDMVVFTGDLINIRASELTERVKAILGSLSAPYGVFSITGNHDSGVYIRNKANSSEEKTLRSVIDIEREMGWQVLEDTTVYIRRGADSIAVSGISFEVSLGLRRHDAVLPPSNLEKVYRNLPDSLFDITLVHLPQLWDQILTTPHGDLTLAGHVHSMQMKLHLGPLHYSPAQLIYKRWSGRYDEQGRTLYINDGTGYVAYPMRLGAYPEISVFTLKQCE